MSQARVAAKNAAADVLAGYVDVGVVREEVIVAEIGPGKLDDHSYRAPLQVVL